MHTLQGTRFERGATCPAGKIATHRGRAGLVSPGKTAFDLSGIPLRTDILMKHDLNPSRYGWRSLPLSEIRRLKDEAVQFAQSHGISLPEGRYNLDGTIDRLNNIEDIEVKLIETDAQELLLCREKTYEEDTLFWLEVKPTFDDMSPEMGRLVRGVYTKLVRYHGFMDLTDWYSSGYGEFVMEDLKDKELDDNDRELLDYLKSAKKGVIKKRMKKAFNTDIKIDEILAYTPTDKEKELHKILIEGIQWISDESKFSLPLFILENEEIDCDFTIESTLRFALTYDIDDKISKDMFKSVNEDTNQGGYMCPVREWKRLNSYSKKICQIENFLEWLRKLSSNI